MMDIVNRLRGEGLHGVITSPSAVSDGKSLTEEAADEIESLRAQLAASEAKQAELVKLAHESAVKQCADKLRAFAVECHFQNPTPDDLRYVADEMESSMLPNQEEKQDAHG